MPSNIFQLSNRSRRMLWRNQHKEYQESIQSDISARRKPTRRIRLPRVDSTPIRLWDPVAFLPPELALMCLREALPSGNNYVPALIELTSVCSKWQNLLFSTPNLWTKIHVRYSSHDLMAIISLFLHLSSEVPLDLIVWNALGSEWEDIKSLLLPHAHRIKSLALGDDPPIYDDSPYAGAAYISLASDIFDSLDRLPGLLDLDFGRPLYIHASQLKTLDMPAGIRVGSLIYASLQNMEATNRSLPLFFGMGTPITLLSGSGILVFEHPSGGQVRYYQWPMYSDSIFANRTALSLNSIILFLLDILRSLAFPETSSSVSTHSSHMIFIDKYTNMCNLCNRQRGPRSMALGCVRSHFGLCPFRCPGCRTCNSRKGYVINILFIHR
jgi:F-box-like